MEGTTPMKAAGILGVLVLAIAVFLAATYLLGVREAWAGFLFFFAFGLIEQMNPEKLASSVLGAATGIAIGMMPVWLAPLAGEALTGLLLVGAVLVAIYLFLLGRLSILVNGVTMTFLTVTAIPHVSQGAAVTDIFLGMTAGAVYFGGLALAVAAIAKSRAKTVSA